MMKRCRHVVACLAIAAAALAATTRPVLPKLDYYSVGMNGSMDIAVTPDGLLTQRSSTNGKGVRSGTRRLTAKQMAELADVAAACLRRPDALERATDVRILHQIGDQKFNEDGTDVRFDDLNAMLSRLAKPVKLRPVPPGK